MKSVNASGSIVTLSPIALNETDPEKNDSLSSAESAFKIPLSVNAFLHTSYFTLRSGGKTIITFFFDSFFMCVVSVPTAFILSRYTNLSVIAIFAAVHCMDLIKCVIGYVLVRKNVWMKNIVVD